MGNLGHLLIGVGVLVGSLGCSWQEEGVNLNLVIIGVVVGVVGVVLARMGAHKETKSEEKITSNLGVLNESLGRIVAQMADLNGEKKEIDVYDLHDQIDARFLVDLDTFAEARESLSHQYGVQAYADLMSHFAAGERYLNRVWCCSVDGYIDECHTFLEKAEEQFKTVASHLEELNSRGRAL